MSNLLTEFFPILAGKTTAQRSSDRMVAQLQSQLANPPPELIPTATNPTWFREVSVPLYYTTALGAANPLDGVNGLAVVADGHGLYMRKSGTPASVNFQLDIGGSRVRAFRPGDLIRQPFDRFALRRSAAALEQFKLVEDATAGEPFYSEAQLVVLGDPAATITEFEPAVGRRPPFMLLGPTINQLVSLTVPSGDTYGHEIGGFRKLAVRLTALGWGGPPVGPALASCTVIPWIGYYKQSAASWIWTVWPQGAVNVVVAGGAVAAGSDCVFSIDLSNVPTEGVRKRIHFEFTDVLDASITELVVECIGVE